MAVENRPPNLASATASLRAALLSMNRLVPGVVPIFVVVAILVILVSLLSIEVLVGLTVLVVLFASIFVYFKSKDYAQAVLSLVVGLLASFTVDWTVGRFVVFFVAWLGLLVFILLISSVRMAANSEAIYTFSAQFVDSNDPQATKKRLEGIGKDPRQNSLGPIERAEVLRVLAVRKVPLDAMPAMQLQAGRLAAITKLDHENVAQVLADLYAVTQINGEEEWQTLADLVYRVICNSTASPVEFVEAFRSSRRLALTGSMDLVTYLTRLQEGIVQGISPKDMLEHIRQA
jgi:hypothetical protein